MVETVSIVIRTLNEARYLDDLLAVIKRQKTNGLSVETVVIDSGSSDGTVEIAQRHEARLTHISKEEFSFGRALNRGSEFGNGDMLVYVSGHCVPVEENWLQELCQPLIDGKASYVYGRQIGDDDSNFSERCIFAKYFPAESAIPQTGFFCNNANSAILRSSWEKNLFDEQLTGLEDMELAKRLVSIGEKIAYVAEAPVFHHHQETWAGIKRRFQREAIALQLISPEIKLTKSDTARCIAQSFFLDLKSAYEYSNWSTNVFDMFRYRLNQYVGSYLGNHEHRQLSTKAKQKFFYPDTDRTTQKDDWLKPHRRTPPHEGQQSKGEV